MRRAAPPSEKHACLWPVCRDDVADWRRTRAGDWDIPLCCTLSAAAAGPRPALALALLKLPLPRHRSRRTSSNLNGWARQSAVLLPLGTAAVPMRSGGGGLGWSPGGARLGWSASASTRGGCCAVEAAADCGLEGLDIGSSGGSAAAAAGRAAAANAPSCSQGGRALAASDAESVLASAAPLGGDDARAHLTCSRQSGPA